MGNAKEVIICNNYFLRDQNLPEDWLTFDAFQILPNLKSARSVQKESKLDDRSPSKKTKTELRTFLKDKFRQNLLLLTSSFQSKLKRIWMILNFSVSVRRRELYYDHVLRVNLILYILIFFSHLYANNI